MNTRITLALAALTAAAALVGCSGTPNLTSLRERGTYFEETKQYDRALAEYKAVIDRKPEDAETRYKYAQTLGKAGRADESREQFLRLVDDDPTNEKYIEGYTQALYDANANGELAAFLVRMTEQRGAVTDYIRQGQYSQKMGDLDGAKTAYQAAAKLDGGRSTKPWIAMADMYKSINDLANERAMVQRALYITPMDPILSKRLRDAGGIPGPSAGIRPDEFVDAPKK